MHLRRILYRAAAVLLAACMLPGCGGTQTASAEAAGASASGTVYEIPEFHTSGFDESQAVDCGALQADFSSLSLGYIAVKAENEKPLKLQIACGEEKYNYDISNTGEPAVLPLNMGNGTYEFRLMQNVDGNRYACLWSDSRTVTLEDEFQPFLRPSIMSNYNEESECVKKAAELASGCADDLEAASAVYTYLVKHIKYDKQKAATVQPGYLPDPDETLSSGKGICFDYASLACAMMRSLGIPCKLITGYVDSDVYHAWNCFYIEGQGWITAGIKASANSWQRVDITFAAGGTGTDKLTDDSRYTTRYTY